MRAIGAPHRAPMARAGRFLREMKRQNARELPGEVRWVVEGTRTRARTGKGLESRRSLVVCNCRSLGRTRRVIECGTMLGETMRVERGATRRGEMGWGRAGMPEGRAGMAGRQSGERRGQMQPTTKHTECEGDLGYWAE